MLTIIYFTQTQGCQAKISSCQVNTTTRRGIKQLGISCGLFFFYFDMNSKYPGAMLTVARGNPQSLALNDSPSNHLVEILEHKHLTMKYDIVGIHWRTSFKIYPNQLSNNYEE